MSSVFPNEIIMEVMTRWGGHRLGLTCSDLLARLSADNYVVEADYRGPGDKRLVTCRLPNGLFHGPSRFDAHEFDYAEYVATYDQGAIKHIDMFWNNEGKKFVCRKTIVRGYQCTRYPKSVFIGIDVVKKAIPVDDLEHFVRTYLDEHDAPEGHRIMIPIFGGWIANILPHVYCVDSAN